MSTDVTNCNLGRCKKSQHTITLFQSGHPSETEVIFLLHKNLSPLYIQEVVQKIKVTKVSLITEIKYSRDERYKTCAHIRSKNSKRRFSSSQLPELPSVTRKESPSISIQVP